MKDEEFDKLKQQALNTILGWVIENELEAVPSTLIELVNRISSSSNACPTGPVAQLIFVMVQYLKAQNDDRCTVNPTSLLAIFNGCTIKAQQWTLVRREFEKMEPWEQDEQQDKRENTALRTLTLNTEAPKEREHEQHRPKRKLLTQLKADSSGSADEKLSFQDTLSLWKEREGNNNGTTKTRRKSPKC